MTFRTIGRRGFHVLSKKSFNEQIINLVPSGSIVWRFNNTSTLVNIKGDAALNGTVVGSPSLVDSPFGTNQGLAMNANGKKVTISTNASLTALANATSYTVLMRLRLAASPGNTIRGLFYYANSSTHNVTISTLDKLDANRGAASVAGRGLSTPSITEGSNVFVAAVFNPADKSNAYRLYQGASTLAEMALSTDTAASGALTSFAGQQLNVCDRTLNDANILAEMVDLFIYTPSGMTLTELNAITAITPK